MPLRGSAQGDAVKDMKVDANLLLQTWIQEGVTGEEQVERINALLPLSKPFMLDLAERVNKLEGAERDEGIKQVVTLARQLESFERDYYGDKVAHALGLTWQKFSRMLKEGKNGKKKDEDEGEPEQFPGPNHHTSWLQKHLVEITYDPEKFRTGFVVRFPDGHVEEKDRLIIEGTTYVPKYVNNMILRGAVLLPSEYTPPADEREVIASIRAHIHKYLEVDDFFENLATYYVLFSWVYDGFEVLPYLRALGDYGTGKTRMLQTVGSICYRPIFTAGATTTSPIFRLLDQWHGTLCLDEADFGKSDESQDIIKILNTGYMKNMPVLRSVDRGTAGFDVEAFDVYGPKVIGTRKRFMDPATESRCLTKEMGAGMVRMDIPIVLPKAFWGEALEIRNMLLGYRMQRAVEQRDVDYNDINRAIENRLNQVTMALKTIVNDEELKKEVDSFVWEYNRQLVVERSTTMTAKVLEALAELGPSWHEHKGQKIQVVFLKTLTAKVNDLIDTQNRAMGDDSMTEERHQETSQSSNQGGEQKERQTIKSRKVGDIVRKYLQLKTDRSSSGPEELKGTYMVLWDDPRIRSLGTRYGVEFPAEWPEKPVQSRTDPFVEERRKWHQAGMAPEESDE